MGKFKNKYRIETCRLKGFDYSSNGSYSITIVTHERKCFFGEIRESHQFEHHLEGPDKYYLNPSEMGSIAQDFWKEIPNHFDFVELGEYQVMPNHIHGILHFNKKLKHKQRENKFGPQSQNLGSVIRSYKSAVKSYANNKQIEFAWQERYFDTIIRNFQHLQDTRKYILNNPRRWIEKRNSFQNRDGCRDA